MLALTAENGGQAVVTYRKTIAPGSARESMIDPQGIVLLDLWYPIPMQPAIMSLSAEIPADFSAISEADEIIYQPTDNPKTRKVTFSSTECSFAS